MQRLLCWIILRHHGIVNSNWQLCRRRLLGCVSDCLFVLSRRFLHRDGIFFSLFELFHGHFRRVGWTECLHGLPSWFVLRHDRFIRGNWQLLCRKIFRKLGDAVFELPGWEFSSHFELVELFVVHSRVILRHHWSDCSDRCLQCGDLFRNLSDGVFELPGWYFSSNCRLFKLLVVHSWVILRYDGIVCSDGKLCCWDVFSCICNCVLVLSRRHLHVNGIFFSLFKLCFRNFIDCWCLDLYY
jgi:hypothetical protein